MNWSGRRVLVTGHTGFKGGWLTAWLLKKGAQVCGFALAPETSPNLFEIMGLEKEIEHHVADLRDAERVRATIAGFQPEVVFHLAAQPLVRRSYRSPLETYAVNVMGTAHVLEAVRHVPSVKATVIVTTDKCYENREWVWPYREQDAMGGYDPYSSSKACAEILTAAYRRSFFSEGSSLVASARAGNVIGGGDWSEDRLVPDAYRAVAQGAPLVIRNPRAQRPWQHVMEPLAGYIGIAEHLLKGRRDIADAFNFGPGPEEALRVEEVLKLMARAWGPEFQWRVEGDREGLHEAMLLQLDSSKARSALAWQPRLGIYTAIDWTVEWYKTALMNPGACRDLTGSQIERYESLIGHEC